MFLLGTWSVCKFGQKMLLQRIKSIVWFWFKKRFFHQHGSFIAHCSKTKSTRSEKQKEKKNCSKFKIMCQRVQDLELPIRLQIQLEWMVQKPSYASSILIMSTTRKQTLLMCRGFLTFPRKRKWWWDIFLELQFYHQKHFIASVICWQDVGMQREDFEMVPKL